MLRPKQTNTKEAKEPTTKEGNEPETWMVKNSETNQEEANNKEAKPTKTK